MMQHAVGQDLYHSKSEIGKEKVKFWMLYQALTTIGPGPGKEIWMPEGHSFARWSAEIAHLGWPFQYMDPDGVLPIIGLQPSIMIAATIPEGDYVIKPL
jgi:hypothetical protein